ncbi:MAG: major capsid protein [Sphaerochaetaceae bacterium]
MSTIDTTGMNLVEANKRAGYTNKAELLAELLKHNSLMQMLPWYESSNKTYHKSTKATRLGHGDFTGPNQGYDIITSQADQTTIPLVEYGAVSMVDERIIQEADDPVKARRVEDIMNMEGMAQHFTDLLFTSDGTSIKSFKGLMPMRSSIGDYVWSSGGSTAGKMTSAWLIEFGLSGLNMRYGSGSAVGFTNEDKGLFQVLDDDGKPYWAWENLYRISGAPEIKQDRAVLRLANIDTSKTTHGSTGWIDTDILSRMIDTLPNFGDNAVLFVNRLVHSQIRSLCYEKGNAAFSFLDITGFGKVQSVLGIPVMLQESITNTEAVVA